MGIIEVNRPMKNYTGNPNIYVLITCIFASMGGLIFGYNIGISGGFASLSPFFQTFFPSEFTNKNHNNLYCFFYSKTLTFFTSSFYLAALLSSFFASFLTCRKISMLCGGLISFIGAVLNATALNIVMLIVGRICLGIGVGFSIHSIPLYIWEMSPSKYHGSFNTFFQLSITLGILMANIINFYTAEMHGDMGWRVSLGSAAVPAFFITISALFLLDTPTSLLERGQTEKTRAMLQRVRCGVSENEVNGVFEEVTNPWKNLVERQYRPQLVMSILIPFFQQLTGINVVMFYAPVLFKTIGFADDAFIYTTLIMIVFIIVCSYGVDEWGRRILFLLGGIFMFISQVMVGVLMAWKFGVSGEVESLPKWYSLVMLLLIIIYVGAFGCSWGPLGWLVPSEIFPLEIRSKAQSITTSVNMLFTFIVAQFSLSMFCHMKFGLFIFFAFFIVVMTIFIYFFLPETNGIPMEEMSNIWRQHWYWNRFFVKVRPQV